MAADDDLTLDEWRAQRLQEAVNELDGGNKTRFGKRLGYEDGSYIRQMIQLKRPITEKFILMFEAQTNRPGWFDRPAGGEAGSLEQQIRIELSIRDVPEYTLRAFLEAIRAYPHRRKLA